MKKTISALAIAVALVLTLSLAPLSASAADTTPQVEALHQMGLFMGTGNGFELSRVSMRVEAAVMLVRLLGKEQEAKAQNYPHPYTDVPSWADSYVGYMYHNGLTKGTSATTFDPQVICTSQMYTVFVLRALGYTEENGSFTFDKALDYAAQLGIVDPTIDAGDFVRSRLADVSYSALFQKQKSTDTILLDKLIADGAVKTSDAASAKATFKTYTDFAAACKASYLDTSTSITRLMKAGVTFDGMSKNFEQEEETQTVVSGGQLTFRENDYMTADVYTENLTYYKDGWLYIQDQDKPGGVKIRTERSLEDYIDGINIKANPFYLIDNISKMTSPAETVYTVNYSPASFESLLGAGLGTLGGLFGDTPLSISTLKETVAFGSDGKLKSQTVTCSVSGSFTYEETSHPVSMDISYQFKINAYGPSVTVTPFSDLDKYVDAAN